MAAAYVGEKGVKTQVAGSGATEVLTLASGGSAGNTIILRVGCRDTSTVASITDSRGNTWTNDVGPFNTGNNFVGIFSTRQDVGTLQAGDSITVTFGTAPSSARLIAADEFSGLLTASPVDQTSSAGSAAAGGSAASGTTSDTTQADELAVMAFTLASPSIGSPVSISPDAAWSDFTTNHVDGSSAPDVPKQLYGQYQILSAVGPQSGTITTTPNFNSYQGLIVTYKALVATGGTACIDFMRGSFPFIPMAKRVSGPLGRPGKKREVPGPSPMGGFERFLFPRLHPVLAIAPIDWEVPIDDTLSLDDAIFFDRGLTIEDVLSLDDNAAIETGKGVSVNDSVSLSDALSFDRTLTISDTLSLADALAFQRAITIGDTAAIADSVTLQRALSMAVNDVLSLADDIAKAYGLTISESLSLLDSANPQLLGPGVALTLNLSDVLTIADKIIRSKGHGPAQPTRHGPILRPFSD